MNKNKFLTIALSTSLLLSAQTVYAATTTTTADVTTSATVKSEKTGSETKKSPVVVVDLSGENKTNLLSKLGLTEDEFEALEINSHKGGKRPEAEMTDEERTQKLEEKADELGITVDELKAEMKTKGERTKTEMTDEERAKKLEEKSDELGVTVDELKVRGRTKGEKTEMTDEEKATIRKNIVLFFEEDIDALATAIGLDEASLTSILEEFKATVEAK